MRALRVLVLLTLVSATVFAQRGGGSRGGGGGGFRGGGGGYQGGGFRGGVGISHGGFRGGGFRSGIRSGYGFNHSRGFFRPGFRGGRSFVSYGFGIGLGYGYGYGYPGYYGYGYPGYYDYGYYPYAPVAAYPATYSYPYYDPAPVVVTQNFGRSDPPPVQSRDYAPRTEEYREPIYLIAHRDHRIEAAIAYWVEGDTLHYVTRQREKKQIPLDGIDRRFTEQLNRDRRVEFNLPR